MYYTEFMKRTHLSNVYKNMKPIQKLQGCPNLVNKKQPPFSVHQPTFDTLVSTLL